MEGFKVGDELDSFVSGNAPLGKMIPDSSEFGIVSENRLPPTGCGCIVEGSGRVPRPAQPLHPGVVRRLVDKRIGFRHVLKAFLIQNEVGAERVQQHKQIMVAKLNGRSGQKDRGFGVVAEEPDRLVRVGVRIADMVCFVHDDEIKARGRVQGEKPLPSLFPVPAIGPRTVKKPLVKQRIRENGFPMLGGPFSIEIHFIYAVPQGSSIQVGEALVKAFHLQFPLALGHQGTRADNENGANLSPRLQLPQNQAGFDGFADPHAVGYQQARTVRSDESQHRAELVGDKINTGSVE